MPHTSPLFRVQSSAIHGVGLFAATSLRSRTRLGTYAGRRMTPAEVEASTWDSHLTYLFGLSDGTVIDGAQGGNHLRHLNHSCNPNCEAVERWGGEGRLQLDIVVLRDVLPHEELCIDYSLSIDDAHAVEAYPCACGAPDCRGTMASQV